VMLQYLLLVLCFQLALLYRWYYPSSSPFSR
jgi:hypothetical protein